MKKAAVLFLSCILLMAMMTPVICGMSPDQVLPMWDNTFTFSADLEFTQTTGDVTVTIIGQSGVTNITSEIKLYYKNIAGVWVEIPNNWQYNTNQMYLSVSESFSGVAGREYQIQVVANVKKNNTVETISKTVTAICPVS